MKTGVGGSRFNARLLKSAAAPPRTKMAPVIRATMMTGAKFAERGKRSTFSRFCGFLRNPHQIIRLTRKAPAIAGMTDFNMSEGRFKSHLLNPAKGSSHH